jgi:chemotaxis protein methyltransferase CheR/type IV pilus assembly protein PilK
MSEALMLRHAPDMDEQAFVRWQALLEARTGVHLPIARKSFLLLALSMRMRELALDDYDAYLDYIQDGRHASFEWACLVDLLTVHDTRFFRNPESIELVRSFCRNVLQQQDVANKRSLTVWSVGCSTGEEVYSLVITLHALQQDVGNFYFGVTGTDISYPALATAREGIYHLRRLTGVSDELREQCFQGCGDDYYQVQPALRQRTCFMQGNVLDATTMPKQQFDIIYCQNVLIYFQPERRRLMLNQIVAHLKPGGMVVLGPGEVLRYSHPQLTRLQHKHCLAFTHRGQHAQAE